MSGARDRMRCPDWLRPRAERDLDNLESGRRRLLPLLSRCDMLLINLACLVAVGIVLIFARVPISGMMVEVMSEKTLEDMLTILDGFALGVVRVSSIATTAIATIDLGIRVYLDLLEIRALDSTISWVISSGGFLPREGADGDAGPAHVLPGMRALPDADSNHDAQPSCGGARRDDL